MLENSLRALVLSADPGVPLLGPSGASAHLRGIARALESSGYSVRVAVPRISDDRGAVDEAFADVSVNAPGKWGCLPPLWRERGETWDSRRLADASAADFSPNLVWERFSLFADGGGRWAQARGIRHLLEVNAPIGLERPKEFLGARQEGSGGCGTERSTFF